MPTDPNFIGVDPNTPNGKTVASTPLSAAGGATKTLEDAAKALATAQATVNATVGFQGFSTVDLPHPPDRVQPASHMITENQAIIDDAKAALEKYNT